MAINKVVYNGDTLVDLTEDTITSSDLLNGITAHNKSGEQITGECTYDSNTTDANATQSDIVNGKTAYVNRNKVTGNYLWNWKGFKPEFIGQVYSLSTTLDKTSFPSWTPSSTASAIKSSTNADTFTADMANYEYLLEWKFRCKAAYQSGTTKKAAPDKECCVIYQSICKRPNSLLTIQTDDFVGNTCLTLFTVPLNQYYSTTPALTYTYSVSYGIYASATAATFSSTTSDTPTVTIKTPAINARCSTSYFSTTMAGKLDQANTTLEMVGNLYRFPIGSTMRNMYETMIDYFNG